MQAVRTALATCQRAEHRYELALLDLDVHSDPTTTQLLAAYRLWIGD